MFGIVSLPFIRSRHEVSSAKLETFAVLSSCDTIRKRGFAAVQPDGAHAKVEEVTTHTLYSVFTRPEYRQRGYASRMMQELRETLRAWDQQDGKQALFATVYSDIGKVYTPLLPCLLNWSV